MEESQPYMFMQADSTVIFNTVGPLKICVKNDKRVGSHGLWYGDNPLEFVLPVTLLQIVLALATSQLFYVLLRPLRTPRFVCSVLGGIVLGPSFLGHSNRFKDALYPARQADFLGTVYTLGAAYFIFIVALKMDVATTLRAARSTWKFGVIPFIASLAVISSLIYAFDVGSVPRMKFASVRTFFSAVMSFSNFIVISETLMELNLASSELGQIALSSAMINDTMQWFTLLLMSLVRTNDLNHSLQFLICYWLLILFCIFVIRPMMMMIVKRTPVGKPVKEVYILCILSGVLIMAALADVIGLSFLQGPLLFGLIMPNGPPLGTTLIEKTQVVIADFLMPLFFVFIGINTNLYELKNWQEIMTLQGIILAGYAVKVLACILIAFSYNMRLKHSLVLGLMLNVKGIVELMTFSRMKKLQVLHEEGFSHMVFSLLLMTSIISPLIKVLYKPDARLDISTKHGGMTRMIQHTPRHAELCIISCVYNEGNVHSTVALLEACNPIRSPICTYVVHFIELSGKSTPFLLPLDDQQRRKSMSINYPNTNHIMRAFENYAQNSNGRVMVRPYVNVAPYKQMHEAVCNLAQDKNIPFLIIPFHENDQTLGISMTASIRDLNSNFQYYAPCTVGILVDRYSQISLSSSQFSFHVGIFFIGGPDDREALSLGIRMMEERENTKVSLFSFVLKNKSPQDVSNNYQILDKKDGEEEEAVERTVDESFIDEFKAKNIGNDDFVFREITVKDGIGVLEAIRGLEGNYDLVMVGRRHSMVNLDDEEMLNFMENVKILGMFGDMLASTEFCNGMVPVLVMHCGGKRYRRWLSRASSASQSNMTP